MTTSQPVRAERLEDGRVLHVVLNRPKGNILDNEMVGAIREAIAEGARDAGVLAVLFEGAGDHFSFGASVKEHLPDQITRMLRYFHGMFRDLVALHRPLLAAVRGQCLGGGLELAAFCHRVFASETASMGQAEIKLGVMAPVASFVLPRRVGQAHADDLLLSGRSVGADEALAMGLVNEIVEDPFQSAMSWIRTHLLDKSGASLRVAVEAARYEHDRAFLSQIDYLETLYVERLMGHRDAEEGIRAFLEKRPPVWSHG
jgi:cyclohexa-1,5-dienecarbonyl-CoA hydratase